MLRVRRGSIASMRTSVDDMLGSNVQGSQRRALSGPFFDLVQSGRHRAARVRVGPQGPQEGRPQVKVFRRHQD